LDTPASAATSKMVGGLRGEAGRAAPFPERAGFIAGNRLTGPSLHGGEMISAA
jgi:hypothetical protein